jgi:hypothetical protein
LFGDFRFRREEGLGGLARVRDLLAIIAAELALLLRAVEQRIASDRLARRPNGRESVNFDKPRRIVGSRPLPSKVLEDVMERLPTSTACRLQQSSGFSRKPEANPASTGRHRIALGSGFCVGDRQARADCQCGELIDRIAASAPIGKLLFVEALGDIWDETVRVQVHSSRSIEARMGDRHLRDNPVYRALGRSSSITSRARAYPIRRVCPVW